jgi:hypothetical protein
MARATEPIPRHRNLLKRRDPTEAEIEMRPQRYSTTLRTTPPQQPHIVRRQIIGPALSIFLMNPNLPG